MHPARRLLARALTFALAGTQAAPVVNGVVSEVLEMRGLGLVALDPAAGGKAATFLVDVESSSFLVRWGDIIGSRFCPTGPPTPLQGRVIRIALPRCGMGAA